MIDHIAIEVSNYNTALVFYKEALKPLGYNLIEENSGFACFSYDLNPDKAIFFFKQGISPSHKAHIAFEAKSRKDVDAFYQAAMQGVKTMENLEYVKFIIRIIMGL